MELKVTTYIRDLAELLLRFEATDSGGAAIPLDVGVQGVLELLDQVRASNKKVIAIGNGGSASIASHLQMDLCNAAYIRTSSFDSTPMLTALSNDYGYPSVYERPISLWLDSGDLLVAISSSGQSENILRAARTAREGGGHVITFSGFKPDNPLRSLGELNFYAPSTSYGHVEVAHMALAHSMADLAVARFRARSAHA